MNDRNANFFLYHWEKKSFRACKKKSATIGRGDADFGFETDTSLSRKHCEITWNEDQFAFFLTDLGSRNGTRLNGKVIPPKKAHPLKDGDWIRVGEQDFYFTLSQTIPDMTRTSQIPGHELEITKENTKSKIKRPSKVLTSSRMIRKKP